MERTRAARAHGDPLGEFRVGPGPPPLELRARLRAYLNAAISEAPLQRFLEQNPLVLVRYLAGGHTRWVIPGLRLGSRFAPDFVIGEQHASRSRWTLVELESPSVRLFTRSGDATRALLHATSRIRGWRDWLHDHSRYAREHLNLAHVGGDAQGVILIGARGSAPRTRNDSGNWKPSTRWRFTRTTGWSMERQRRRPDHADGDRRRRYARRMSGRASSARICLNTSAGRHGLTT